MCIYENVNAIFIDTIKIITLSLNIFNTLLYKL